MAQLACLAFHQLRVALLDGIRSAQGRNLEEILQFGVMACSSEHAGGFLAHPQDCSIGRAVHHEYLGMIQDQVEILRKAGNSETTMVTPFICPRMSKKGEQVSL